MNEQEVVIVGYTAPRRSRQYFGALVLAVRQGSQWQYVGHAGTGFDEEMLQSLYEKMQPLKTKAKRFVILALDEQPILVALVPLRVHPHQVPAAVEFLARDQKKMAGRGSDPV